MNENMYECMVCKTKDVSEKVKEYSVKHHGGTILCFSCQKKSNQVVKDGVSDSVASRKVSSVSKDRLIVRQNVLNRAVDMFCADKISQGEIIDTAIKFESWVMGE